MPVIVAVIVGKTVVGSFRRHVRKSMHVPDLVEHGPHQQPQHQQCQEACTQQGSY